MSKSVRIPDRSYEKAQTLKADGGYESLTSIMAVAIDRLYRAETPKERTMQNERYFQCENCGQTVQGWHAAMEWVDCCDNKQMVEIDGPGAEMDRLHAEALELIRQES